RAPKAGELPHRPELATVARGMNAAREGKRTWSAERVGRWRRHVKGCVESLDLLLGVGEADLAQLAGLVSAPPLRNFGAQAIELAPFVTVTGNALPPQVSRRRHRTPLCV